MTDILEAIINKKNPDHVRIRYYPSYKICQPDSKSTDIQCIMTTNLEQVEMTKLFAFLKTQPHVSGNFTEYGIRDMFVRVSNISNQESIPLSAERIFFRREMHMFVRDNFSGVFVAEMYKICDEEDLPYVGTYQHDASYFSTTYDIDEKYGNLRVCCTKTKFTSGKFKNNASNDDPVNEIDSYVDMNKDISLNDTAHLSKALHEFFDDIVRFRTLLKLHL